MRVALLGGTGFVGSHIVDALLAQQHTPRLLARPGSEQKVSRAAECETITGDVDNNDAIEQLVQGADALIYNIGILREFPAQGISFKALQSEGVKRVADIAESLGVQRFILMSANGAEQSLTEYQRTKLAAENYIKQSELDWTIFRPSVIFGNPHGNQEFALMLKQQLIDPPLPVPLFHAGILPSDAGGFALSPVHVEDVAMTFAAALGMDETIGHTYTLGGPQDLSWKQILQMLAEVSGKRKLMLPVPAALPGFAASLLDRFPWFPISQDQITMLLAGNTCRGDEIFNLCGIKPRPFNAEQLDYLKC